MPKVKQTTAEIELQLSERRFILEAINTGAALLQVPIVTAGIWYYLSRTNPALGALNKAILAAELAPIIGDIKFPEGVLLGAAMESTEDFLKILEGEGLLNWIPGGETAEKIISKAHQTTIDTGGVLAEFLMPKGMKLMSCEDLNQKLWNGHLAGTGRMEGPEGVGPNPDTNGILEASGVYEFGWSLLALKNNGCDKPTHPYFVSDKMWAEI